MLSCRVLSRKLSSEVPWQTPVVLLPLSPLHIVLASNGLLKPLELGYRRSVQVGQLLHVCTHSPRSEPPARSNHAPTCTVTLSGCSVSRSPIWPHKGGACGGRGTRGVSTQAIEVLVGPLACRLPSLIPAINQQSRTRTQNAHCFVFTSA